MPIYDHNGNVLSEVSKIYDDDGSVLSQIGKVYDNNGTADSLIYTAETIFYDGPGKQAVSVVQVNWPVFGDFYGSVSTDTGTNANGTVCYIPVDLTGIDTLQVNGTFASNAWHARSGVWIATSAQTLNCKYPFYPLTSASSGTYYTLLWQITAGTAYGTTFDVSKLTGVYYLCAGTYVQNPNGAASFSISSVIGY